MGIILEKKEKTGREPCEGKKMGSRIRAAKSFKEER
jgi:hypothetical protein